MDTTFYTISKLAWHALSPSNFLIILATIGVIFLIFNNRKLAKIFLIPSVSLLFVFMSFPVSDFIMMPLEKRFNIPKEMPEKIDGIIILGGAEDIPRSASWRRPQMGDAGERFIETARLARRYPNVPVIFTGSSGNLYFKVDGIDYRLAEYYLRTLGIPKERLIIEDFSGNTYENFVFVKPLLPDEEGTYLLVTSAYHMPRSVGIARKQGVNVIPYPVDYRSRSAYHRQFKFQFANNLVILEPAVKEWIGLTVYYLVGRTSAWFPK